MEVLEWFPGLHADSETDLLKQVGVEDRRCRKMWCEGEELKKFVSLMEWS